MGNLEHSIWLLDLPQYACQSFYVHDRHQLFCQIDQEIHNKTHDIQHKHQYQNQCSCSQKRWPLWKYSCICPFKIHTCSKYLLWEAGREVILFLEEKLGNQSNHQHLWGENRPSHLHVVNELLLEKLRTLYLWFIFTLESFHWLSVIHLASH